MTLSRDFAARSFPSFCISSPVKALIDLMLQTDPSAMIVVNATTMQTLVYFKPISYHITIGVAIF
jgi:hypothetical protein